jgi:hypothetical protein
MLPRPAFVPFKCNMSARRHHLALRGLVEEVLLL